jgi:carbon-monoxide dehydrogenase small subunit
MAASDMIEIKMTINGAEVSGSVEGRTLLVQFIRDYIGLTGTHIGCDTSQCGCCTLHMNGVAVKSCTILAAHADGADIATIEGLADGDTLHPMQEAFRDNHALQCGYCTPGMVMSALAIVNKNPDPTDEEIRHGLEGNLCRCTGYHNIIRAVAAGAKVMRS